MNARLLFAMLFTFLAAGCRQDPYLDAHIELMNAERRTLEDKLYEAEAELEQCRKKSESGRETPSSEGSSSGEEEEYRPPQIDDGIPDVPDIPEIEIPGLDPSAKDRRTGNGRVALGAGDPRVAKVLIHKDATGGVDFDETPGDDGVLVVFETQNEEGAFVPIPGPVTVVLLDYARQGMGESARVARWEFDAKQVADSLKEMPLKRGIQLLLPWPGETPRSRRFRLDLRYTTLDGRNLDVQQDIELAGPGEISRRWTPRTADQGSEPSQPPAEQASDSVAIPEWKPYR